MFSLAVWRAGIIAAMKEFNLLENLGNFGGIKKMWTKPFTGAHSWRGPTVVAVWKKNDASCVKKTDFTATPLSAFGLVVQCRRSLTSSSRGQRWLLQGHCTELINGPSYVAAVCLMSLITTEHTSRPETHTHSESLGLSAATSPHLSHPFLWHPLRHFTSDGDRNS